MQDEATSSMFFVCLFCFVLEWWGGGGVRGGNDLRKQGGWVQMESYHISWITFKSYEDKFVSKVIFFFLKKKQHNLAHE